MPSSADLTSRTRRGIYFFLSYAHSVMTAERIGSDADPSVAKFFEDLRRKVAEYARPAGDMRIAFFDQQIPPMSDLKTELSEALGQAEVFIPLYSPTYFARAWPMREREVFLGRLNKIPRVDTGRHIVPVLWTAFPSWETPPPGVDEAISLAADVSGYAENGLRALCMLTTYRSSYAEVLDRLAKKVVQVVERFPIGPSAAPDLDEVPGQTEAEVAFAVAVLAPRHGPSPVLGLGPDTSLHRPFADRRAPGVALYVASTAERMGFQTKVVDVRQTATLAKYPAIVIVDPWIFADDQGPGLLEATFKGLPDWVVPLVVSVEEGDPQRASSGEALADSTVSALMIGGRSAVDATTTMDDLAAIIPRVVSKARRTYLRKAPVFPPPGLSQKARGEAPGQTGSQREDEIDE